MHEFTSSVDAVGEVLAADGSGAGSETAALLG
jgi:hypothetical protein